MIFRYGSNRCLRGRILMKSEDKNTYTGVVQHEADRYVLATDQGPVLELRLNLGNSIHAFTVAHRELEALVGRRVRVEVVLVRDCPAILVSNRTHIKELSPSSPSSPPRPAP